MLLPWTPEEQRRHRADLEAALAQGETRGRYQRPRRNHQPVEWTAPPLPDHPEPPKGDYARGNTLEELLAAW